MSTKAKGTARRSTLRDIERTLEECRSGRPSLPAVLQLPVMELLAGGPLTFITFEEWCRMNWPDYLYPEEWEIDPDAASSRTTDILFGSWLSWYSQYTTVASVLSSKGTGARVRRLHDGPVREVIFEEKLFHPTRGDELYASFSFLVDPATGGTACAACVLHDEVGEFYAAAFAWNSWTEATPVDAAVKTLDKWAERLCRVRDKFWAWKDPEAYEPFVLSPDPAYGGIAPPYVEPVFVPSKHAKKERRETGKVIPFRPRNAVH